MRRRKTLAIALLLCGCGGVEAPVAPSQVDPPPLTSAPPGYVVVPSGSFTMGAPADEAGRESNEGPTHRVTLTHAFLLGRTEVTVDAFSRFVAETGWQTSAERAGWGRADNGSVQTPGVSWRTPPFEIRGDHPVVFVSWFDAVAYADWRSVGDGLPACYEGGFEPDCLGWRLPTEAEWEWAARAGSTAAWPAGAPASPGCGPDPRVDAVAWTCSNSRGPNPVATLAPNRWGLHDLQGNVWEWVHDEHRRFRARPVTDPVSTGGRGDDRSTRGGGWGSNVYTVRVAVRVGDEPDVGFDNLGFRLARTIPPNDPHGGGGPPRDRDHRPPDRSTRGPSGADAAALEETARAALAQDPHDASAALGLASGLSGQGRLTEALPAALLAIHLARGEDDMA